MSLAKTLLLFGFTVSGILGAFAQAIDNRPSVLNAAGGSKTASDGLMYDFSLGEFSLTQTFTTSSFSLTQGFLQQFYWPEFYSSDIKVVQNVSPNGDGIGDFLFIENIEKYPKNTFHLFNRYGNEVFSIDNYNNTDRVFKGYSNTRNKQLFLNNGILPDGTYYYVLTVESVPVSRAQKNLKGFIVIKTK